MQGSLELCQTLLEQVVGWRWGRHEGLAQIDTHTRSCGRLVGTIHAGLCNTTESRGDVQNAITGIGKAEKRTCA